MTSIKDVRGEKPFALADVYAHPGNIRHHDCAGPRKRVCVIGGGIAGLTASYELRCCDHSVLILESSMRPGGRIRTAHYSDSTHGELGAMRVPANHGSTLHYIEQFGLTTQPFINTNPAAKFRIRGEGVRRGAWQPIGERFQLRDRERKDPLRLYEELMQKAMALLSTEDKHELFEGIFRSGQVRSFDAQTLWQFLRRWLSEEAIQFVGHATGMIWYEHASFLEALVDYFGLFRIDSLQLAEGMDALPNAFAKRLGNSLRLGCEATRVAIGENGVEVSWNSPAGPQSEFFDYAICTVPAPRVGAIEFTPELPPRQRAALNGVAYASGAKTLLHCRRRPWEYIEGIFGGGTFTDLRIQQCWYPSDNARPASGEVARAFTGDDPQVSGGNHSQAPAQWQARSVELSRSPGVLTGAYMWEANARRFAALSDGQRTDLVLADLAELHPELIGEVEDVQHVIWDEEVGGGTYAFFAPGDYQRFHGALRQPFPHEDPRVFFAGEHLAISHAWIQGAVQTGWQAASHVAQMGAGSLSTLCPALRDQEAV